jgi:hypothetical protein
MNFKDDVKETVIKKKKKKKKKLWIIKLVSLRKKKHSGVDGVFKMTIDYWCKMGV